ncbi:MAG: tripartite tricarboxylate transporter substrate binding protein, partial [Burkholderiales bacterium]
YVWLGLLGPRGLPSNIRDLVSATVLRVLKTPELAQRAAKDGYDIVASTPAQFTSDVRTETSTVERVIRDNGIKASE